MALDKIQGLGLGLNPFVKPKDADDASNSTKIRGVGYEHVKHEGKHNAYGIEKNSDKSKGQGLSFLKEGALGDDEALYVRGGRAGAKHNLIA